MAFVPVPDTLAVDVLYELNGQKVENTLYFTSSEGWTIVSANDWLDQLNTLIQEELLPLLASAIKLVQLVGTLLDAVDSFSTILNVSPPVEGGAASGAAPNNVTYTIQFKTVNRGRSFRGRNYVPGLPLDQISGNNVSDGLRTGLLAFYTELLALAATNGTPWVVVSRFNGGAPRTTGVATPVTTVATFDQVLDSQRRRLPGRGT